MQEHPWLDRLYVKLALQVKKNTKNKKTLAIIEPKVEKNPKNKQAKKREKRKTKNQRRLGEPTAATCSGVAHADGLWNEKEIKPQGWALL